LPKLRLFVIAAFLVLAVSSALFYCLRPDPGVRVRAAAASEEAPPPQGIEPQVREVTYNHMEDGTLKWNLVAQGGEFNPLTGYIALRKVRLTCYLAGGGQLYVEGDEGQYNQERQVVELTGNVFGRNQNQVTIRSNRLVYRESGQTVETNELVTVAGPTFSITSLGMKALVPLERIYFEKQVNSVFWPEKGQAGPLG
jgi:LPS export ABC transporter protein LptC